MRNKLLIFSLSIILIMSLFTGCAGSKNNNKQETSAAQSNSATETKENTDAGEKPDTANEESTAEATSDSNINSTSKENKASMEIGQVTAIDGYNITLALNKGRDRQIQEENGAGKQPKEPQNTTEQTSSEALPEVPSDNLPPKDASTKETEEKVVALTDDTAVNIEDGDSTKTGTIEDITVGCMLSITYEKDNSGNLIPSSVTIRNSADGPNGQRPAGKNPPTDSTATESENN